MTPSPRFLRKFYAPPVTMLIFSLIYFFLSNSEDASVTPKEGTSTFQEVGEVLVSALTILRNMVALLIVLLIVGYIMRKPIMRLIDLYSIHSRKKLERELKTFNFSNDFITYQLFINEHTDELPKGIGYQTEKITDTIIKSKNHRRKKEAVKYAAKVFSTDYFITAYKKLESTVDNETALKTFKHDCLITGSFEQSEIYIPIANTIKEFGELKNNYLKGDTTTC